MIFTLHGRRDATGTPRTETVTAIAEAAAAWALVAPPLWLVWHRLWFALAVYLLIGALVLAGLFTPYWPAALLLAGLPAFYLFLEGNQLRRHALERSGAQMMGVVDAPDADVAVARFLAEHGVEEEAAPPAARPAPPAGMRGDPPAFGLFAENGP